MKTRNDKSKVQRHRSALEAAYLRGMKDAVKISEETECVWPPAAIRDRIQELESPESLDPEDITIADRAAYFDAALAEKGGK